jgi:hypothetical protein
MSGSVVQGLNAPGYSPSPGWGDLGECGMSGSVVQGLNAPGYSPSPRWGDLGECGMSGSVVQGLNALVLTIFFLLRVNICCHYRISAADHGLELVPAPPDRDPSRLAVPSATEEPTQFG